MIQKEKMWKNDNLLFKESRTSREKRLTESDSNFYEITIDGIKVNNVEIISIEEDKKENIVFYRMKFKANIKSKTYDYTIDFSNFSIDSSLREYEPLYIDSGYVEGTILRTEPLAKDIKKVIADDIFRISTDYNGPRLPSSLEFRGKNIDTSELGAYYLNDSKLTYAKVKFDDYTVESINSIIDYI